MRRRTRHNTPVTMERRVPPPRFVFHWNLTSDDHMLGTVCHGLKVAICPHTRSDDLMILVWPILASLVPNPVLNSKGIVPRCIICLDKPFYATAVSQPSHHPQFIVITVFEEAIRDLLITCLADGVLFWCTP